MTVDLHVGNGLSVLEFVLAVVQAIVWPIVVIAALAMFRRPLIALAPHLRSLKVGPVAAEFERGLERVEENAAIPVDAVPALAGEETDDVAIASLEATGGEDGSDDVTEQDGGAGQREIRTPPDSPPIGESLGINPATVSRWTRSNADLAWSVGGPNDHWSARLLPPSKARVRRAWQGIMWELRRLASVTGMTEGGPTSYVLNYLPPRVSATIQELAGLYEVAMSGMGNELSLEQINRYVSSSALAVREIQALLNKLDGLKSKVAPS
jgi:hypothetical protein